MVVEGQVDLDEGVFLRELLDGELRRDEAALIVQRLIDKDANRRITVSGSMVPGAVVTINNRTIEAADDGAFSFEIVQDSSNPITFAVIDTRN